MINISPFFTLPIIHHTLFTPDLFHSHYFQFQTFENILMYGVYLILFGMQIYMHKLHEYTCATVSCWNNQMQSMEV